MVISIVLPVYNVQDYLRQGLETIINQTYKKLEIICVDDGSTDNSSKILAEYALLDNRIKIITQKNSGTFIARKNGVAAINGDYVLFFDPDDWLELDACEQIVHFLSKIDTDIIQYDMIVEADDFNNPTVQWLDKYFNSKVNSIEGADLMMIECYEKQLVPWNLIGKVVRASVAKKAYEVQTPVQFSTLTDYIAMYYIYTFSKSFKHLPLKLYHYRYGTGVSTLMDRDLSDFKKNIRNIDGYYALKKWVESNDFVTEVGNRIALNVMYNYVMDASLHYALYRLNENITHCEWSTILLDKMSREDFAYSLGKKIKEFQRLINECNLKIEENSLIIKQKDEIIGHKNDVVKIKDELIEKLRKKKNKYLLYVKILFLLIIIQLVFFSYYSTIFPLMRFYLK